MKKDARKILYGTITRLLVLTIIDPINAKVVESFTQKVEVQGGTIQTQLN